MHYTRNSHIASDVTDGQISVTGGCGMRKSYVVPDNLDTVQIQIFSRESEHRRSCNALNTTQCIEVEI